MLPVYPLTLFKNGTVLRCMLHPDRGDPPYVGGRPNDSLNLPSPIFALKEEVLYVTLAT
jgi:hypothetical protein